MMSKRVGEVRIFAGRWVRRQGPVHVADWANNLTKVNPEALEKGTHPRNHQAGGLPWARYSVDELNQQAKAGDRPYPEDLRSIFWAAPHDPDEDFHWARKISSWTLPGLLGMFGHSFTLRQLWGVWESLPLLQGPRQRDWGRKASLVLRLLYYIFPQVDWHLVFVDDYCWVLRCSHSHPGYSAGAGSPAFLEENGALPDQYLVGICGGPNHALCTAGSSQACHNPGHS